MEDELNLDELEVQTEEKLKVKNRIEKLSEKVILTAKEKEEAIAKAQAEAEARLQAEKERDFYKDFSVNVTKYPNASAYQDKILEKVKSGYSTEDAMVAVLAKEGKLEMTSQQVQQTISSPEGGSAPTIFEGTKSLSEMTPDEKMALLAEADKTGDLVNALRGR